MRNKYITAYRINSKIVGLRQYIMSDISHLVDGKNNDLINGIYINAWNILHPISHIIKRKI